MVNLFNFPIYRYRDFENRDEHIGFGSPVQSITNREMLYGFANRFLYSSAYKAAYLVLALLSLVCLVLTLTEPSASYDNICLLIPDNI